MNKELLGIIDATTYHEGLEELIVHRSLAAVPFAGRYRLIDFILSNMVNSGIKSVAIFPKYQYRSLMDHLGSGKNWDLNRKKDGIGSFHHFAANMDYFKRSTQEYALISNCFTVFNMDFRTVLSWHRNTGCDITEIVNNGKSMGMYLVKTSLLIDLIETRDQTGYSCMKDVVTDIHHNYQLCTYNYTGFAVMINSIKNYYSTSLSLLQPDAWKMLFLKDQPIYTKVKDEPPTRYLKGSEVKNSMIANGCQIDGKVENSIIARGVKIGKNTIIRNSIIMQKCQIGDNCVIDSMIIDKDVKVEPGTVLTASVDTPQVIRKGTVQGALMNS